MNVKKKVVNNEQSHRTFLNSNYNSSKDGSISEIVEQYRVYVDTTIKFRENRLTTNAFFISLCITIMAAIGYFIIEKYSLVNTATNPKEYLKFVWVIPLFGAAISYDWLRFTKVYRCLNIEKSIVIREFEQYLPVRPFETEWDDVGDGNNKYRYQPFFHTEILLPVIFLCSFVGILFWILWKFNF